MQGRRGMPGLKRIMTNFNNTTADLNLDELKRALASSEKEANKKPACLLVLGGELNGTVFDLKTSENSFGRSEDNTYLLESESISRKHFKVTVTAGNQAVLEDLKSSNGTYLNNSKIPGPTALRQGDVIQVGNISLKYIAKGDPERLAYDKLNLDACTDGLTKCFNKAYFNKAVEEEVNKSKATGQPLTLIVFDLDHFKNLNDNFGHDAGDFVLKEIAALIRKNGIREGDVFSRYGGEEFVVLLPKTDLKKGVVIAKRLRKLVEAHQFIYDKKRLPVTVSIGVADCSHGVANGADLFKRADVAVYRSKEGGRNRVSYYK
jgi:diguanylate cyclase (GGDEF)-like protein